MRAVHPVVLPAKELLSAVHATAAQDTKTLTSDSPYADPSEWKTLAALPFVDVSRSRSALARALYSPWFSRPRIFWAQYTLLQRRRLSAPHLAQSPPSQPPPADATSDTSAEL